MTDRDRGEQEAQNIAVVTDVMTHFSDTGEMKELGLDQLREVLKVCGARVEGLPEAATNGLMHYSNEARAAGIREVWGEERYRDYRKWIKEMVDWYENEQGIVLPALPKSGIKTSGMTGWLGDLTSLATSAWTFDRYKEVSEARWETGRIWRSDTERHHTKRPRILLPDGRPHVPASYQPDFPPKALDKVLSWRTASSNE